MVPDRAVPAGRGAHPGTARYGSPMTTTPPQDRVRAHPAKYPWEVERDRFGTMFSGPLDVGECIAVVPAYELEAARSALRDVRAELGHGATANWDYIERRFAEGLGEIVG
jgi:hypothetical protein